MIKHTMAQEKKRRYRPIPEEQNHEKKSTKESIPKLSGFVKSRSESTSTNAGNPMLISDMYPSKKQLREKAEAAASACILHSKNSANWKKQGMALLNLKTYSISVEKLHEAKNCLETAYKLEEPKDAHTVLHLGITYISILNMKRCIYEEDTTSFKKICDDGIAHFENLEKLAPRLYDTTTCIKHLKAQTEMLSDRLILEKQSHEENSVVAMTLQELSGSVKSSSESTLTIAGNPMLNSDMYPSRKQLHKMAKAAASACILNPNNSANWKRQGMALLNLKTHSISVKKLHEAKNCLETTYTLEERKDVHTVLHLGIAYISILNMSRCIYEEGTTAFKKFCDDGIACFENLEKLAPRVYNTTSCIKHLEKMRSCRLILEKQSHEKLYGSVECPSENTLAIAVAKALLKKVLSRIPEDNPAEEYLVRAYDLLIEGM